MSEDRPFLELPLPSEEDRKLYEEWLEKKRKVEEDDDSDGVIIIDI